MDLLSSNGSTTIYSIGVRYSGYSLSFSGSVHRTGSKDLLSPYHALFIISVKCLDGFNSNNSTSKMASVPIIQGFCVTFEYAHHYVPPPRSSFNSCQMEYLHHNKLTFDFQHTTIPFWNQCKMLNTLEMFSENPVRHYQYPFPFQEDGTERQNCVYKECEHSSRAV